MRALATAKPNISHILAAIEEEVLERFPDSWGSSHRAQLCAPHSELAPFMHWVTIRFAGKCK